MANGCELSGPASSLQLSSRRKWLRINHFEGTWAGPLQREPV